MDFETLAYEVEDRVLTITLDRPDRMNAFNNVLRDEFIAAIDAADADDDIRAIIVTGRGRAFCAGADLEAGGATFDRDRRPDGDKANGIARDGGGLVTLRLFESTKPLIAAVNGAAVGVGVTMTLPMDVRLAGESARFGFVFARRGIVPEACSTWFLPRVVGISKALEWSYSGRVFPAAEAHAGGLVSEVVPDDQLLGRAREIAAEIAQNTSAVSVALTRQMMWRLLGADHPMEAHKLDSRAIQALGQMADAKEGVESFLEKRPAEFSLSPTADMPDFVPWWEEPRFW